MSPMTATIPMSRIERTVYKSFASVKSTSLILSEFLSKLELQNIISDEGMIKFSKLAVVKSLILMELRGFKSHRILSEHLKANENDAVALGFLRNGENAVMVPDQRSFSYFVVHKLTESEKEIIKIITEKIREISEKFGIGLDIDIKIEKETKPKKDSTLQYHKENKTAELTKRIRQTVYPKIKLVIRHNAKYSKSTILDVLVHSALEGSFTHGGASSYKRQNPISPESSTVLYHLKKHDAQSVKSVFYKVSDEIFRIAKSCGIFKRRKLDVSIDYTYQHFYGNPGSANIVYSKPDHGTSKYFRYITIDIVEDGARFTLCALPSQIFDSEADLVKELLEYAKSKISINRVYMDRGFANSRIFNLLKSMGLKYIIPLPEDAGIKKLMTGSYPFVIRNYRRADAIIPRLVLVEGRKGLMKIATNIEISTRDVDLIENLPRLYSKRWGIETGYRVKKREGLVKTTSKNYSVRLFYFLFSVALYNLWILINALAAIELGIKTKSKITTFKLFLKLMCQIIYT